VGFNEFKSTVTYFSKGSGRDVLSEGGGNCGSLKVIISNDGVLANNVKELIALTLDVAAAIIYICCGSNNCF
jgi:hypothetical protein